MVWARMLAYITGCPPQKPLQVAICTTPGADAEQGSVRFARHPLTNCAGERLVVFRLLATR